MKVTYKASMRKRIIYLCISAGLLLIGILSYSKIISEFPNFRIGMIAACCILVVILIIQIFHIYELVFLKNKGVEYFNDDSAEFDENEEAIQKKFEQDYEFGQNDEDFEFLLKDGEYTYDTAEEIFCPECGGRREQDWIVCPICGKNFTEAMEIEYCPNCGEELDEEDDYCPKCGYSLNKDI